MACLMNPASWVPEKGRITSGEREMDCARELNRGRCADMWVSPHILIMIGEILVLFRYITRLESNEIFSPSNKIHREVGRAKHPCSPHNNMTQS